MAVTSPWAARSSPWSVVVISLATDRSSWIVSNLDRAWPVASSLLWCRIARHRSSSAFWLSRIAFSSDIHISFELAHGGVQSVHHGLGFFGIRYRSVLVGLRQVLDALRQNLSYLSAQQLSDLILLRLLGLPQPAYVKRDASWDGGTT